MDNLFEDVASGAPDRRRFLQKLSFAGAAVMAGVPKMLAQTTTSPAITDADILQFALNLEYLEAEFYTYATTGAGIDQQGTASIVITGSGAAGETTGGQQAFINSRMVALVAAELASDEQAHVRLIRAALTAAGITPVAKPAIDLGALGLGFGSERDFLFVSRILEDIGVTAYAGAAPLIQDKAILGTAAQILATEAEHVGNVRLMAALSYVTSQALDGVDILPPPTGTNFFSTDANALVKTRNPGQVLFLAYGNQANVKSGGFFPNGVNGTINTSAASA
jgi:Ferritin-like domain